MGGLVSVTGPHTLRCESCGMQASTQNSHHPDKENLLDAVLVALFEAHHANCATSEADDVE